tara:strand:+ start:496 stop:1530 length:1035 start_codon:yes stop_codon:yes gene_type:complete
MAYSAIDKPSEHFSTTLYTGNGSYPRSVTGIGFQPDFVWLKNRDVAYWHQLYDAVRGTGTGGGVIYSNSAAGNDDTYKLNSFDSDGFTLPSALSAKNDSGEKIAAWCWKGANGTASNTAGDVTSTVSANPTAGISIVTATSTATSGNTAIGHGLGKTPDVVFARNLAQGFNWDVWFRTLGYTSSLIFNSTATGRTGFGSGTNDSNVFSALWNYSAYNGQKYLYYCFTSIKGFSKISQYVGNGQSDGPFVYTGFKPAMIITKRSDATSDWRIWDHKRDPENDVNKILYPSAANAEGNETFGDFYSNGFKPRVTTSDYNAAGGVYQYLAFAENPFVTSGGVPVPAR